MKLLKCFTAVCFVMIGQSAELSPPTPEPGMTRLQAEDILSELKSIHQLLATSVAGAPGSPVADGPATMKVESTDDILGNKAAPVTIVEFSDYQCPFCRQFHNTTFEAIRKSYLDTGKARLIAVDYPLPQHTDAEPAAEAVHCAADQGKFWEMRDTVTQDGAPLDKAAFEAYADKLHMDVPQFSACISQGKYRDLVATNQKRGAAIGVKGTPTFLIGKTTPDGVTGTVVEGNQPAATFSFRIQQSDIK